MYALVWLLSELYCYHFAYEILCKLELEIQISSIVVEGFEFIVLHVILDFKCLFIKLAAQNLRKEIFMNDLMTM